MRAFIAIELPEDIKGYLKDLILALRQTGSDVKWIEPANIHLTLKFLGEISEEQLEPVKEAVSQVARDNSVYPLSLSGIGAFPRLTSPRVIWAGISQGKDQTCKIAAELEEKLALLGFLKEEREFSCHITLGRVRSAAGLHRLVKLLGRSDPPFVPEGPAFNASAITLFQSRLSPKGPSYEPLSVSLLKE